MKSQQTMKPATAAKKLGVYLEATPEEFQAGVVSRDELNDLQANPPQWLADLRRNGPHPKQLIAQKLGISTSGLVRAGITDVLFGDVHPTGKLPHSWPRSMAQIPINQGDASYDPLFPYAFGLTY